MSNIRQNLIAYLQKRFVGAFTYDVRVDTGRLDEDRTDLSLWPTIAFDWKNGFKQRAIAVPKLGSVLAVRAIAENSNRWFEEMNSNILMRFGNYIKQTSSAIGSSEMPFSAKVIVYTDRMNVSYDEVINTFDEVGSAVEVIEEAEMYQSVFVSYGGPDEAVASEINSYLKDKGISTWFFPEDAEPGAKLHRVMYEGVNKHDRVLFLCSQSSLSRPGVVNELERVLEREAREGGTDILVPVALDDYVFSNWKPSREDIAAQFRARVIVKLDKSNNDLYQSTLSKIHNAFRKK